MIPSRETIQDVSTDPDGNVVTTDITCPTTVLSWEDGVDKNYANVSRIRVHEFVTRAFVDDGNSNETIESKYNYSNYITGSYISLEYKDNTYLYEIVSHIPDTDPLRSAKHEIGSTGECFYQFGVVSVQSTDDVVVTPTTVNVVRLFTEETGINVGEADQRYVLTTGDNVTGTLSFNEVAQPINISDSVGETLTITVDGTATQPNLNDNLLDGNLVNRKNLTDAIDASESGSDGKFVKLIGDTMSGDLIIENANFEVTDINSDPFTTIDVVNKKVTVAGEVFASEVKSRIVDSAQSSNLELKWNGTTKVYIGETNISANAFVKLQKEGVDDDHAVTKKYVDDRASSVQANLDTVHELDNVEITNSGGSGCTIEGASETQSGVVTTGGQVFTGTKTFKTDGKAIDIDGSLACQGDEGTPGYVLTSKGPGNKVEWTSSNSEPGVPKGIVMFWPMEKAMIPFGWYALDGSTHSFDAAVDINFSSLHQVIKDKLVGYTYDDSAETGTLPDWSDRFAGQTGPNNGDDPGELKGSLTKRPVTNFKTNNQSSSHSHLVGIGHGHGNTIAASTKSGGIHKHTIDSDLFVNKDNSKGNGGSKVNYTRSAYHDSSSSSLTTKTMGSTEGHSHTVEMSGSVTDYTDPNPLTRKTNSQDTSHNHSITSGGDSVTRPQSVIGYWIIRS